jgi:hypothetical protein
MPPRDRTFNITAKAFSGTYSQANDVKKEELFTYLSGLLQPKYLLVAEEAHKDGGTHFHIAFGFDVRRNYGNPRFIDYAGYHPSIEATRNPKEWCRYITKCDPDPMSLGEWPKYKRTWADCLAAETKPAFLSSVREVAPRDFILANDRVQAYALRHYKADTTYIPGTEHFLLPEEILMWQNFNFCQGVR